MNKENMLLKYFSIIALVLNGSAIIFHIIPYLGLSSIGTVSTILFLITAGIDLGLIYLTLTYINREDNIGQNLKKICWIYLVLFLLAIYLLMADSLVYSFIEVGSILRFFAAVGGQLAYIVIFGLGIITTYYILRNIDRPETWR